ncbi:MAG: glycosyltransferase family 39 protein [Candidatus Shapirobacteria bacterium]|jgi:4-amino-4-deoxy-L-arabinose transferase-like glycosyltransferase|nr:glycosyltransferase family 39 protein [Candidatus Shapirobacteria bacterium]
MEFLGDQGRDVVIIKDFLKNGNLFFIGPQTSIGNMYLGPFFYYLISPSLLLSNFHPVGPAIFIAIINITTVALIFFISKKWFNSKTAYIAAFLYAISPVVIKYSNFIWNPNIMPIFSLLFVYFFFESFKTKQYKLLIYTALSFVMVMNSHYLGLALLPFVGIFWLYKLFIFKQSKSKEFKPFLINTGLAILVFLLSLLPQVLFDIKHNGQNIKSLITFFTYRESTVNIKAYKALPELPGLFNQVNTDLLAGRDKTVGLIISIIFSLCLLPLILKYKKQTPTFWIVFFWYLSGLVALALYKQHVYAHYFAFLFPAVFILIAFLISKSRFIGIPLFILITIFSLINNPFRYQPNNQLKTVNQIADLIIANSNQQIFNFSLLAKQNYDPPYRYILNNKQAKIVDLPENHADQLFVVCEPFQIDCNPINNPEWSVAAFGWAKIDQEWEINGIKIFKLIKNPDAPKD